MLITRGAGGEVRAFVNSCSHRGAIVVPDGLGTAAAFRVPVPQLDLRHEG